MIRINMTENMRYLDESSLSRIWQHIEDPNRSFGVLTSHRKEDEQGRRYTDAENEERYERLKELTRNMGYGYVEMDGGYTGDEGFVEEPSLFIPEISRNDLMELGRMFNQESVIYKDDSFFGLIETSTGNVWQEFISSGGRQNITLGNEEIFKQFFSSLVKGSHAGRKFVFTPVED